MIILGVTHAQYELRGHCMFRFGGADSIVNNNDIGFMMIVLWSHMFSAKYTIVAFVSPEGSSERDCDH